MHSRYQHPPFHQHQRQRRELHQHAVILTGALRGSHARHKLDHLGIPVEIDQLVEPNEVVLGLRPKPHQPGHFLVFAQVLAVWRLHRRRVPEPLAPLPLLPVVVKICANAASVRTLAKSASRSIFAGSVAASSTSRRNIASASIFFPNREYPQARLNSTSRRISVFATSQGFAAACCSSSTAFSYWPVRHKRLRSASRS